MYIVSYVLGMYDWNPFEIDIGMDLWVAGQSWLRESREVFGGLHVCPRLWELEEFTSSPVHC